MGNPSGSGGVQDPHRVDPTGTTVQPVSVVGTVTTSGGGGGAVTVADGADVAQGTTSDGAWVSGAGTVIALLKKIASAGGSAVSIADGADVAQGTTTDVAVTSDVAGTLSAKLRGLIKIFADVWDSVNHRLKVDGSGVTQPVSGTFFQATQPVSGTVTAAQATAASLNATVVGPTLTKGTQGAAGFSVQELKDAGRNSTSFFTVVPIVTTSSEALLSLTGFKADALVTATTTPAVITSGKKYRITGINVTYVAIATAGSVRMSLRKHVGGTVLVTDPVLWQAVVGGPAAVAGVSQTVSFDVDMEINAGDGIGVSQIGLSTTQVAAAVGYGAITIYGYEY